MYILIVSRGVPTQESPMLGIFEFDQARALKLAGHKIVYLSLDFRSMRWHRRYGRYWTSIEGIDVLCISWPLGLIPDFILFLIAKISLLIFAHEIKDKHGIPEVVHAHFTKIGFMARTLKVLFKVPLVITEHSSHINKENISKSLKRLAEKSYGFADSLIVVSNSFKERIKANFGIESEVVHNIVDVDQFMCKNLINSEIFTFISVGRLDYNKGFDVLIEAFAKADFANNINLIIVGSGSYKEELQKQIRSLNIGSQVKLVGFKDRFEISSMMQNSNAFVLASRSETFGVVLIEALASGLPVVSTQSGGPADIIDIHNGILVPVDDVNSLSYALRSMYKNYDKYNRKEISKRAKERFSPQKIAMELVYVYKKVINTEL